MQNFYSPLRYPGGKNCIFKFIANLFYENDLIGINYAEPYAGGAGLALRLLFEGYVNKVFINDYDRSIYAFWYSILDKPDSFCRWIEKVEVSTKSWEYYKDIQRNKDDCEISDLARSTFFLNRTNVSGVIKGGIIGGYNQKGKYKINARFNKRYLIERIEKISKNADRINVSNLDGIKFYKKIKNKNEETFIYLDPPYYQKGAGLYMNFYTKKDHEQLAKYVKKQNNYWIVSYDNHDFILNLFPEKRKVIHKLSQSASNRVGDEVLIFSDSISYESSIMALNQPEEIGKIVTS